MHECQYSRAARESNLFLRVIRGGARGEFALLQKSQKFLCCMQKSVKKLFYQVQKTVKISFIAVQKSAQIFFIACKKVCEFPL